MDKESATTPAAGRNKTLITYSVLTGLTPLIPVPLADDLVKGYFRRRLIRALAEAHGLELSGDDVSALARERRGGCLGGCLPQLVLYPLKKLFRKVFYFLEWKRAADLTSHTYHYGYLVDYAFGRGLVGASAGSVPGADDVRAAIERACAEAPIRPLEGAVRTTFRQSKAVLFSAASKAGKALRGVSGRADEGRMAREIGAVEAEEREQVEGLVERLQRKIGGIPEEHFAELRERFDGHLPQG